MINYNIIYEKANKTSNEKIAKLKKLNEFCLSNQKIFGENVVKELKYLCDMSIKGNTNSKEISNTGEYPFYKASVSNPSGTNNTFCFNDIEYLLFIKSGGNSSNPLSLSHGIGKVYLVNGKSSGNTEVVKIKNNEFVILHLWTFKMPILVFIILVFSYLIFLNIFGLSIICSI